MSESERYDDYPQLALCAFYKDDGQGVVLAVKGDKIEDDFTSERSIELFDILNSENEDRSFPQIPGTGIWIWEGVYHCTLDDDGNDDGGGYLITKSWREPNVTEWAAIIERSHPFDAPLDDNAPPPRNYESPDNPFNQKLRL